MRALGILLAGLGAPVALWSLLLALASGFEPGALGAGGRFEQAWVIGAVAGGLGGLALAWRFGLRRPFRALLGRMAWGDGLRGLALGLGAVALLHAGLRAGGWLAAFPAPADLAGRLGLALAVGLGASAAEEMLFRGALYGALAGPEGRARRRAIAGSALLFALAHAGQFRLGWLQAAGGLAGLGALGLLLGALRARTGGLLAGAGLHAGLVAAFVLGDGLGAWSPAPGAPGALLGAGYPLAGPAGWAALGGIALLARRIFPPAC